MNKIILSFVFLLCFSAAAEVKCPKCGFSNDDGERYCVSCMTEMAAISEQEKNRLDSINKKRDELVSAFLEIQAEKEKSRPPEKASGADTFVISTIAGNGEAVTLEDHAVKGAVTVFDFYADWCGPCRALTPKIEEFVQAGKKIYLKKINIVRWDSPAASKYQINSIPSVWIYDRNGNLAAARLNSMDSIRSAVAGLEE